MRGTRVAAATAALALLVSSCSDDDPQPRVAPSQSPSPSSPSTSPTAEPSETAPTMPAVAAGDDARGAIAFVRYFWQMADYAQATGDVEGLARLGSLQCKPCSAGVKFIEDAYNKGATFAGGTTTLTEVTAAPFSVRNKRGFQVRLKVKNSKQVVDYPGTSEDRVFAAATVDTQFLLEREDDGWVVSFWEAS